GGEEDRIHVFASDLGDEPHVGMQSLDARGYRDDLLDQLAAHERGQEPGARAGEEDAIASGRQSGLGFHATEKLDDLLGLASVVALIVLPADLAVLDHHRLDGGGPHVDPDDLHRPSFLPTCRRMRAAVAAARPSCGTRYVAFFITGCASM